MDWWNNYNSFEQNKFKFYKIISKKVKYNSSRNFTPNHNSKDSLQIPISTFKKRQTKAFLQIISLPSYKHALPIPYPHHSHRINLISA